MASSAAPSRAMPAGERLTPEAPLAMKNTESFVLISPSTVIRLKVLPIALLRSSAASSGERAASVVTTQSIVAIAGEIIPAPLAQTPRWTSPSTVGTSRAHILGKRSVVMTLASKSGPPPGTTALAALAMPAASVPSSSGTPIIPVDPTATLAVGMPRTSAHALCIARATCMPCSPVQALALPLFMATARM